MKMIEPLNIPFRMRAEEIAGLIVLVIMASFVGLLLIGMILLSLFLIGK